MVGHVPEHLKNQGMCERVVEISPWQLKNVPDRLKTHLMSNEAVRNNLCMMLFVADHLWTQEMCNEIMRTMPNAFHRILDRFKNTKNVH